MPNIVKEGNIVTIGAYPQTVKPAELGIVAQLETGYFQGVDGGLYAAARLPAGDQDTVAYFRVEPLKWRVISEKTTGTVRDLTLLCECVLDAMPFQTNVEQRKKRYVTTVGEDMYEANDWEGSVIRRWLNFDFLQRAFGAELSQYIAPHLVTTDGFRTKDRIYLPTNKVAVSYKLTDCPVTDYALAKGAGCGEIWLREAGPVSGVATYAPKPKDMGKEPNVKEVRGIVPMLHILAEVTK